MSSSIPILVGLDCGTSVVKAAAFTSDGTELATGEATIAPNSPQPGWMEYDPEALWSAACRALRNLCDKLGPAAANIQALAPTGAGNGLLLTDANGHPVRPGILSLDNRSEAAGRRGVGFADAARSLHGQSSWSGQTIELLAWIAEHEPEALAQSERLFLIKDYVKWRLCGVHASDPSEMSKVGLIDRSTKSPSDALFGLYGLHGLSRILPEIAPCANVIGKIRADVSMATGLPAGTQVVNGLADIDASAAGSGVHREGQLSIVAGTWSINQFFTTNPKPRESIFGVSDYAIEGLSEELEASASSTANLTWVVQQFCRDLEPEAAAKGVSIYELVSGQIAELPPASTTVFFHPYLYGSNTRPNARAGFHGLAGWHDRRHLLAALFEGVVYSHAKHVAQLLLPGRVASEIRLSGGASRSKVWSQMFADVLALPVVLPKATEVGALGAAMTAATAAGIHPDLPTAIRSMGRDAGRFEPDPRLTPVYARRFALHSRLTTLNEPIWDELEALTNHPTPIES